MLSSVLPHPGLYHLFLHIDNCACLFGIYVAPQLFISFLIKVLIEVTLHMFLFILQDLPGFPLCDLCFDILPYISPCSQRYFPFMVTTFFIKHCTDPIRRNSFHDISVQWLVILHCLFSPMLPVLIRSPDTTYIILVIIIICSCLFSPLWSWCAVGILLEPLTWDI